MAAVVIDKGVCTPEHPAPLLFVHSGVRLVWGWSDHFVSFFVERGYRAVFVNLLDEDGSVRDSVAGLRSVALGLPAEPVMVGHSMGGYVVQKYLQRYPAPAAVLLDSVPPWGVSRMVMRRRRPATPILVLGAGGADHVSRSQVCATARAYGTVAEIVVGAGGPQWSTAADRIDGWLGDRWL